jgi:hypothetical protein
MTELVNLKFKNFVCDFEETLPRKSVLSDLVIRRGLVGGSGGRERERDLVATEFLEGYLNDLRQAESVKDVSDGVSHIEHEEAQAAVFLVRAGTFLVSALAHAGYRSEWTVDQSDDFAHENIVRWAGEEESTVLAALAIDDTGFAELREDLLEKRKRDVLAGGDLLEREQIAASLAGDGEINEGAQGVFAAFGEFHSGSKAARRGDACKLL